MPQIMMTIGTLTLLAGLLGIIRLALTSRIITPPFCRGCKYDLAGLEIATMGKCPECGQEIREGSRWVRRSRLKIRYVRLAIFISLLVAGSIGVASPKLMNHRMFDRVDWYGHWSDSSLLLFERVGDERALMYLFQRFGRGELSDASVDRLTKKANRRYQTEQAGDWAGVLRGSWHQVMMLAMLEHRLTDEQLHGFIEYTVNASVEMRTLINRNDQTVFANISIDEPGFVSRTNFAQAPWRIRNSFPMNERFISPFSLRGTLWLVPVSDIGTTSKEIGPITPAIWAHRPQHVTAAIHVPVDQSTFEFFIEYRFEVMEGKKLVHAWTHRVAKTIRRSSDDDFEYAQAIDDVSAIKSLIERLSMTSVTVTTGTEEVRAHREIKNYIHPVIRLKSNKLFEHSILGDIWLRVGEIEIPYEPIEWKVVDRPPHPTGLSVDFAGWGWSSSNDVDQVLNFFDRHAAFWAIALDVGKVDVLIVPNAELAKRYPGVSSFVNRTIIFPDVSVQAFKPVILSRTNNKGEPRDVFRWQPVTVSGKTPSRPQPVMAELFNADDS